MKKLIPFLCAIFVCMGLTACGQKDITIDPQALADDLLANVNFELEITKIDASMANVMYPDLPEGVDATIYAAGGAGADEISIFTAADTDQAKEVLSVAEAYIETQKESYASYNPKEVQKLEQAIVLQKGKYVIVCVTNDADNARSRIEQFCK